MVTTHRIVEHEPLLHRSVTLDLLKRNRTTSRGGMRPGQRGPLRLIGSLKQGTVGPVGLELSQMRRSGPETAGIRESG